MGSKRAKDPVANLFNDAADQEVAVHERHSALPEAVQIGVVHDELGQLTCKDKCYEPLRRTGIFPKKYSHDCREWTLINAWVAKLETSHVLQGNKNKFIGVAAITYQCPILG